MKLQHPLTRAMYERCDDGSVRVKGNGDDNEEGIFDRYGNWISGSRRHADPLMCMYVSDGFKQVPGAVHSPIATAGEPR